MAYNPDKIQTTEEFKQVGLPDLPIQEPSIVETENGAMLQVGDFFSPNYSKGKSGWKVDSLGNAEFLGNLTLGNYLGGQGIFWNKTTGIFNILANLNLGTTNSIKGGMTDYLTGIGFFLGYSGGAYKFSVGNPAGDYMAWDGTNIIITKSGITASAGTALIAFSDGNASTGDPNYALEKEIVVGQPGEFRISFKLNHITSAPYGKIYRNNVAVGTERIGDGTYSEDISGWRQGDLCQVYIKIPAGGTVTISNFRIYSNSWQVNI